MYESFCLPGRCSDHVITGYDSWLINCDNILQCLQLFSSASKLYIYSLYIYIRIYNILYMYL